MRGDVGTALSYCEYSSDYQLHFPPSNFLPFKLFSTTILCHLILVSQQATLYHNGV